EANALLAATLAQFCGKGNEVIIVDPDDIVRLQDRQEGIGKFGIDAAIPFDEGRLVFYEIKAVVEEWPKDTVGETQVIFLVILFRQRDRCLGYRPDLADPGFREALIFERLAIPAQPHATPLSQGIAYT